MSFPMLRPCAACGATNRIPAHHVADRARCGSCKAALPPVAEPIDVDEAGFAAVVGHARVPVFVDFWAAWCGPCRAAAPVVHELAREMAGRALVLKVDTEAHPALSARYAVRAIPTFMVLKDGRLVTQHPGLASRDDMRRWLEDAGA